MATDTSPPEIDVQWTDATSAQGTAYSIGAPPLDVNAIKDEASNITLTASSPQTPGGLNPPDFSDCHTADEIMAAIVGWRNRVANAALASDDPQPGVEIPCNLQYTGNQQFTDTDEHFKKKTGISRWGIWRNPGENRYSLVFTNEAHWHYYFRDETDDVYENNTFRNADHSIMYKSEHPNIKSVRVQ